MASVEWAARLNILRDRAVADVVGRGNDEDAESFTTAAEVPADVTTEVVTEAVTEVATEVEAAEEPVRSLQCVLCLEQFEDRMVVTLPCNRNHHYCTGCVMDLFQRSFIDEGLFPPRCCQQAISIDLVDDILTPEMVATYHAKRIEIGTTNRVYCCNRECSIFLPPREGAESLLCERCETRTCTICKNAAHEGDCPEDEAGQALRALADQEGWMRCPRCGRTIELTHGCYHITCLCRTQFCYVCAATWKNCECPQWEEIRLLARAEEVVRAERQNAALQPRPFGAPAPAPPEPIQQEEINRMAVELERRHNCVHPHFRSLRGRFECEMCYQIMPEFIRDCSTCHLRVCRRCKLNRL
ncbi:hypothetical protein BGZ60DRAFT_390969 [Tricladium varicosporioides]|nr:hypothetical protein BGZ60DRAFT_390969 [Hymenoscyphus varicosporioides]